MKYINKKDRKPNRKFAKLIAAYVQLINKTMQNK